MKKYFILAAAALVALTACTKVDVPTTVENSKKITFEVANYSKQNLTKDGETSLATGEGIFTFNTYATQFPEIGDPMLFMSNEVIKAWDNSNPAEVVTASNVYSTTNTSGKKVYSWAPDNDYFWPKTGYINFYSYAGTKSPSTSSVVSPDKKTVTFDYGTVEVGSNDNILVADAALHFNANTSTYHLDELSSTKTGVPTLFRRQLGRVIFTVHLKTSQTASSNTKWQVRTIATETIDEVEYNSYLQIVKNGSLKLQNVDGLATNAGKNTTTQVWTAVTGGATNVDGWIAADHATAANNEVITLAAQTLTIPVGETESQESETAYLIPERSVMPQLTANTKFVLYYEVCAYHGSETTPFLKEIRSVGVTPVKSMGELASITDWNKNTKVTYHIIIDPVSEKVTFDPAVEAWSTDESAEINVPLS